MANEDVLAHWYQRFDSYSMSTQEFYERLSAQISRREMPDVTLFRKNLPEGGLLSAHRDYLHVRRGKFTFALCAAPFGIDFFVSWWLLFEPGCLSGCVSVILPPLALLQRQTTFYEEDTAETFRECVHQAVLETIDGLFASREKPPEFDRKPKIRGRLLA
jgi:hypothetical protein